MLKLEAPQQHLTLALWHFIKNEKNKLSALDEI